MQTTDIVMDTAGERLPLLKQSIECLLERTTSPYRLCVIDDASTDGTARYLRGLKKEGKIAKVLLRRKRLGIPANWNAILRMTTSQIVVYTNGDVLCPETDPDWLSRGLIALAHNPDVGMLSLNSPMCNAKRTIKVYSRRKHVVICDRVPSFYLFIRRELLEQVRLPKVGDTYMGIRMGANYARIDRMWSGAARVHGYKVGYLPGVYCKHIGVHSLRTGESLARWSIRCDPITLRPEDRRYLG